MRRTSRSRVTRLALAGIVGAGVVLAASSAVGLASFDQAAGLDPLGHGGIVALPPPGLCCLCPLLDEPILALSGAEVDTLVIDDGHRLPRPTRRITT